MFHFRRLLGVIDVLVGMLAVVPVSAAATATGNASTPQATAPCQSIPAAGSRSLTVSGATGAVVLVHVPNALSAGAATPLVLNLHGSGSTAAEQEAFSGMDAAADKHGFIVIYPQAAIVSGTGFDWNIPGVPLAGGAAVPRGARDDVAFLRQVVNQAEQSFCIDPSRVFVTGFSGGGRMASQLACDASDVFAAAAPVSGLRLPAACDATRAMPIIAFHGGADAVDPFAGHGQAYWTYSVPDAARMWAAHDGCSATPDQSQPVAGVTLTVFKTCGAGAAVELYEVNALGHEWPGGPAMPKRITRLLGPQSNLIDANELMWALFSSHPLPAAA